MKKLSIALLCMVTLALTACGNANTSSQNDNGEAAKSTSSKNLKVGDLFAFAGLDANALIPSFVNEVLEEKSRENYACIEFRHGDTNNVTVEELNNWLEVVYNNIKSAADDGRMWSIGSFGELTPDDELLEPKKVTTKNGYLSVVYKHEGIWYYVKARHGAVHPIFDGDPAKYYGASVEVKGDYYVEIQ